MTNTKRYDIDYVKFATERVPVHVQEPEHNAWVVRLISPFVSIYTWLLSLRQTTLYRLAITPQVCYLEKLLNDRYDNTLRRITIIDGNQYDALPVYTKPESKPVYFYLKSETLKPKVYLFTKGEVSPFTFDFVVRVPAAVVFNLNEMSALVQQYKLAGKIFSIQTI